MRDIYDELQVLENRLWSLEKGQREGYLKDRIFDIRHRLILVLLKIRERL